jgi:catechol 2,3-dioxygenase-like lactoylglutathione lyase family enzyme
MARMELHGIHHVTAITADAPANVEFYVGVLGLRMVKKTVNQDDPSVYPDPRARKVAAGQRFST